MIGVYVNFFAVVVGGIIGTLIRGGIPEKYKNAINKGIALCIFVIGVSGAVITQDQLMMVICVVIGTVIGEIIGIEKGIEKLGAYAQKRFSGGNGFAEGFVNATLLFAVGSMAVVGSLDAGLTGDSSTLLAKSALDGVAAVMFASTFGAGVILSAVPLTLYQGGIALLAVWIKPYLGDDVILEMKAVGSLLIIALGFNMLLDVRGGKIRVANMLPAMFLPIAYLPLQNWITSMI